MWHPEKTQTHLSALSIRRPTKKNILFYTLAFNLYFMYMCKCINDDHWTYVYVSLRMYNIFIDKGNMN